MRTALLIAAACTSLSISAQNWQFDLGPKVGGFGLNGTNERPLPAVPSSATGDEDQAFEGIFYDPDLNQLHINVGWGSHPDVGGTDLSGPATAAHIHGPADVNNSASDLYPLTSAISPAGVDSRTGFIGTIITLVDIGGYSVAEQEADLLGNLWYINIHTAAYPGGEIRGQLLYVIPEPQHYAAMAGLALLGFAGYRRYKTGTATA